MNKIRINGCLCFLILLVAACQKADVLDYPPTTSNDAKISALSLFNGTKNILLRADIDTVANQIHAVVDPSADITRLAPRATIADGATINPPMGVFTDFSSPKTYTVTAGDRVNSRAWVIHVSKE